MAQPTRQASAGTAERIGGAVSFRGVSKAFADPAKGSYFVAVRDIDLEIPAGKFVSVVGPSGCGKSTLLNMTAGLFQPTTGTVLYNGKPVTAVNTEVGYITQQDNLLPWRTLRANVALALEVRGVPRRERDELVRASIESVGLTGFEGRFPAQLSGGMRKRAGLARTMVYAPETLLMDEPFGALDAMMRATLQQDLLRMWERDQRTVIFVTHDLEEAILLSDQVVVFGTKPGRIIHIEDVDFERPRDLHEIRRTPEFTAVWERLWKLIEGEL
jgi:NitT/TauT family transport system ATP-binding protein